MANHATMNAVNGASTDASAPTATLPASQGSSTAAVVPTQQGPSNRVDVIDSEHGRILCLADVRGKVSLINQLAKEHQAKAVIHSGDFGFYESSSLERISDRTLRHLIQYSSLITSGFRSQLLSPSTAPGRVRELLAQPPVGSLASPSATPQAVNFGLSEFPDLLNGSLKLDVPVYTVWGACEDVAILEKIRAGDPAYAIPHLTVLDEATTRCLVIGGVRLRLFGLGGAIVPHKLFDNGEGGATIAGGQGTMWTTVLQVGEMVDTAQRCYDPSETRLLVTHASPGREGLLAQLGLVLKADLTVSAGLHFRYGVSYNEFSVQHDQETFRAKLHQAKASFNEIYDTVKDQVKAVIDENQTILLENALAVANRVPIAPQPGVGGPHTEEAAWKNSWNWNLPDAAYGSLILDIRDGRVGAELRSQGFNFSYRQQQAQQNRAQAAARPPQQQSFRPPFAAGKPHAGPAAASGNPPVLSSSTATAGQPSQSVGPGSAGTQGSRGIAPPLSAVKPAASPAQSSEAVNPPPAQVAQKNHKAQQKSHEDKPNGSHTPNASDSAPATANNSAGSPAAANGSSAVDSRAAEAATPPAGTPGGGAKRPRNKKRHGGGKSDAERSGAEKSEIEGLSRPATALSQARAATPASEPAAAPSLPKLEDANPGVGEASGNESATPGGRGRGGRGGGRGRGGRGGRGRGGPGNVGSDHRPSSPAPTPGGAGSPSSARPNRGGYGGSGFAAATLAGAGIQAKPSTPGW